MNLSALFAPSSVAVIGASSDPDKTSGRPIAYLRKHGYTGAIWPVNPRVTRVGELTCYADCASLPAAPDVGMVLLGAERAIDAVRNLAARGTKIAIVVASGFGETGAQGAARQVRLRAAAGTMRLLGPNTIGTVDVKHHVMLSASGALEIDALPEGHIALVSQSGGILGSLLARAAARGIGFSKLIATGNEVDIDACDAIDHLLDDTDTHVIALYLEGLRRPDRFRALAARARDVGKPIVVYKVGRSECGARAAASHTGALAGSDRAHAAFFKQCAVIRAESFAELLELPQALVTRRVMRGDRVAILTTTGGAGTLVADACGLAGFTSPIPDTTTAQTLRALQDGPEAVLDRNPVDLTLAGVKPDVFRAATRALLASDSYDAVIVIVGSSALRQPDIAAGAIIDCLPHTDKPLLAYVSPEAPHILAKLNRAGAPAMAQPESCAAALTALRWRRALLTTMPLYSPAATIVIRADNRYNEAQAKQLFADHGIASVREYVAHSPNGACIHARTLAAQTAGNTVVLKMLSHAVMHKTEAGGVRLNVPIEHVAHIAAELLALPGAEGVLVQEQVAGGVEMIVGAHRDPQLGLVILLGSGGTAAELLQDSAVRIAPINRSDVIAMLDELKLAPLLSGYRGRSLCDVDALIDATLAFDRIARGIGAALVSAEINPLFVLPKGEGVRAADGVITLS